MLDLAIIGGGPAGLTAGLYATRGGLKNVIMFEKAMMGGQITSSSEVENYPGIPTVVTGMELMEKWPEQAMRFGLKQEQDQVMKVTKNSDNSYKLETMMGNVYNAMSLIIATGSIPKKAEVEGEDKYFGRGVSTCATCDGFFYKDKEVAVLGGGDTALEEALHLAKLCSKVYIIHRRDEFRAATSTIARVQNKENIELITNSITKEITGDNMGVNGIIITNKESQEDTTLDKVEGVFVFVGREVENSYLKDEEGNCICALTDSGEIITDINMNTSVEGLYAAGDIRAESPKQVVCASSDGAIAALQAINYVNRIKEENE
jgi:thioredoxin reductase (NADPH)